MSINGQEKPLYLQLVDELEVKIRESMVPNEKLFLERELTHLYGVSRITVRLALQELENVVWSIKNMVWILWAMPCFGNFRTS